MSLLQDNELDVFHISSFITWTRARLCIAREPVVTTCSLLLRCREEKRMKEITKRRVKANKAIMKLLQDVMDVYPDWRFQQLLMNVGVVDGVDRFYEEPDTTLARLRENVGLDK